MLPPLCVPVSMLAGNRCHAVPAAVKTAADVIHRISKSTNFTSPVGAVEIPLCIAELAELASVASAFDDR